MSPWVGGCDDQVMHLISEIACLESLRKDGMDDFTFYLHVFILRTLVISTKGDAGPKMPVNADGSLSHKQLSKNITMAFRIAACIFLRNLAPRFNARQKFLMKLVCISPSIYPLGPRWIRPQRFLGLPRRRLDQRS
ncbi:Transcriptional regulatory protein pro-1 [Fusarium odoratissimum]|uniref:Transcriptional regulatory protein pro-1 n=2 Tax=Fusarium oxysporum species complex TaxID=171631 RepID=N1SBI3_FUSC4|nr:Transcriptional regulatory protein pro-1 [Fusarium odoratissimum]ENH75955.1 Transcriptional regulatory protein pro-1 [Fusarium oxysporum f. sp. cubense race 1]